MSVEQAMRERFANDADLQRFCLQYARHVVEAWEAAPDRARAFNQEHGDGSQALFETLLDVYREAIGGVEMYEAAKAFLTES